MVKLEMNAEFLVPNISLLKSFRALHPSHLIFYDVIHLTYF